MSILQDIPKSFSDAHVQVSKILAIGHYIEDKWLVVEELTKHWFGENEKEA